MANVVEVLSRPELIPLLRKAAEDPKRFRRRWSGITLERVTQVALECGYFDPEVVRLTHELFQTLTWLTKEELEELAERLEEVACNGEEA